VFILNTAYTIRTFHHTSRHLSLLVIHELEQSIIHNCSGRERTERATYLRWMRVRRSIDDNVTLDIKPFYIVKDHSTIYLNKLYICYI